MYSSLPEVRSIPAVPQGLGIIALLLRLLRSSWSASYYADQEFVTSLTQVPARNNKAPLLMGAEKETKSPVLAKVMVTRRIHIQHAISRVYTPHVCMEKFATRLR